MYLLDLYFRFHLTMLFIIGFYSHTVTMSLSDRERPYGFSPLSSTDRIDACTFHRASDVFNLILFFYCLSKANFKNSRDTATWSFYSSYTPLARSQL